MGWFQVNTWARMVSPDPEPLWMQAAPWSPATKGPVSGEVVYVPLTDAKELDALKGKLAGKIVLLGSTRPTPDITKPLFTRYTDEELKEMESYEPGGSFSLTNPAFRKRYADYMQRAALRKQALAMMSRRRRARDHHAQPRWWLMAAVPASSSTTTARTSRAMRRSRRTRSRFPTP